MSRLLTAFAVLGLAGACAPGGDPQVGRSDGPNGPPPAAEADAQGRCWSSETIEPAIYEQVMGEVQVVPAQVAPDGVVLRPPVYRRAPVPRVVRPREEIRFEAPCPSEMTPELIASLQRALAARDIFGGNVTGKLDAPTAAAIRAYQSGRGLDSAQLSLESARALGLIEVEIPDA